MAEFAAWEDPDAVEDPAWPFLGAREDEEEDPWLDSLEGVWLFTEDSGADVVVLGAPVIWPETATLVGGAWPPPRIAPVEIGTKPVVGAAPEPERAV